MVLTIIAALFLKRERDEINMATFSDEFPLSILRSVVLGLELYMLHFLSAFCCPHVRFCQ